MTISGLLSGVLNPQGRGYVLSRAAERAQANRPANPASEASPACDCGQPECPRCVGTSAAVGGANPAVQDTVELSPEALAAQDGSPTPGGIEAGDRGVADLNEELSDEEREQVDELKQRDREVRQHEQAHLSAAGPHASGGPTFEYQTGPDGRRYAVGGEVNIDTSPVEGELQATVQKMQVVRAAALAPGEPSAQDRAVAAKAAAEMQTAQTKLAAESTGDASDSGEDRKADASDSVMAAERSPYDRRDSVGAQLIDTYA